MKYVMLLFLFISCARKPEDIGKIVKEYDWKCVKTGSSTGVGFTSGGSIALTSHSYCRISKCFLLHRKLYKYSSTIVKKELVNDKLCIKE